MPRIAKCHKNIPLLAEKAERRQAAAFHWQFLCTLALNLKWNINKISLDQISFESTEIILKKCFSSAENSWKCLFLISWTSLNFLGQFLVPNQSGDNSSLASLTKHAPDAQTLRLYKHSIFKPTALWCFSIEHHITGASSISVTYLFCLCCTFSCINNITAVGGQKIILNSL